MTILSDNEILLLINRKNLVIHPFSKENLTPAGYDFSCATAFNLPPKKQKTVATTEHLEIPNNILGTIHLKSSLCREALIGSFAIIDPGFRGNLTLSLFNSGDESIHINKNEPIVQVVFHKTGRPSSNPYRGRYQDSLGVVESKRKFT